MTNDKPRALDILGVGPIAESVRKVTDATFDGAAAVLSRICLPAADEFGLLLRDRVRYWRAINIARLTVRTEQKMNALKVPADAHGHPRIVSRIVEEGSWIDDEQIQDMWGGLLASSCSPDGNDDSNLLFINILSQMSRLQARLLNHACERAQKKLSPNGLLLADEFTASLDELRTITGENDIHRLDREMDHLRALELIDGGFPAHAVETTANIRPTPLALHMYARCKGCRGSATEFFGLSQNPTL